MTDTYAENMAGEKLVFLFGDGGAPTEAFTRTCSINTNSKLDLTADVYQGTRANCTDPSKPDLPSRRVKGLDVKYTGSGMADEATYKAMVLLWKAAEPFNGQVIQDHDSGLTIEGPWIIESIGLGGAHHEDQAFDISIAIAGAFEIS